MTEPNKQNEETREQQYRPPTHSQSVVESRLAGKNLLVLAHRYSHFTKEQVDQLADFFEEIHVYVRYNRLTDLSTFVNSETLKKFGTDFKVAEDSPSNVHVHLTPLTYLPLDIWYRYLGRHHLAAMRRQLADCNVEFDAIHSHFTWTAGYVGAVLSDELDIPNITTIHEDEHRLEDERSSGNPALYRSWRDADALIRVNRKDCGWLSAYNPTTYHIPNGFSRRRYPIVEKEAARDELGIDPDRPMLFSLTALIPRKNTDLLLDAIEQMAFDEPIYCAIGGRGKERSRIESRVESMETEHTIDVLGYIPEAELHLWMNACDVFTLSSNAEGNPTTMFEALGCGKPYVGTNVGGVDEIITAEEYGLISPPEDATALRENLREALQRDWDRAQILEYSEQFTWEKIARQVGCVLVDVRQDHNEQETRRQ